MGRPRTESLPANKVSPLIYASDSEGGIYYFLSIILRRYAANSLNPGVESRRLLPTYGLKESWECYYDACSPA